MEIFIVTEQRTERRMVAILAADAVGFSRLMSEREEATLGILQICQKIFLDAISAHGGRIFGGAGDSVIAEFPSVVEAVRCAVEIQQILARRNIDVAKEDNMLFRIGIHAGDVIVVGDNLMGEGVNVSARLEALADPGGINISGYVYDQVRNKIEAGFQDMGAKALKNIPEPVRIYKVISDQAAVAPATQPSKPAPAVARRRGLVLVAATVMVIAVGIGFAVAPIGGHTAKWWAAQPTVAPSILVLPFANKSDDRGQDYFVDGITEDIITAFSRLSNLTVLAWSTSASYKGKAVKPQDLGRELGVRYILGGSVRKSGDELRITAELTDASNGKQLWTERYDRKTADVFAVQDDVTKKIVQALAVKLTVGEKGQLAHSATNNIAAYEAFLKGQQYFAQRTKESNALALGAYRRAIELDPAFSRAYGGMALIMVMDVQYGWTDTPTETLDQAFTLAKQAVLLGNDIPQTHWALGRVYVARKEYENAEKAVAKSISIAPNYADGYGLLALIYNALGKSKEAIEFVHKGMRLNPYYSSEYPYILGRAYFELGQYKEAIEALEKAQAHNENAWQVKLALAASYIRAGRTADAGWVVDQLVLQNPNITLSLVEKVSQFSNPEPKRAFLEDLRKAGLPD